jgi:hypothetical protein
LSRIVTSFILSFIFMVSALAPAAKADGDALLGTWSLDAVKSSIESGPVPKSETRTYRIANTGGSLTLVVEGFEADGTTYAYGATGDIDGKEYPIAGRDEGAHILGDRISWRRIDPEMIEMIIKKKGDVINTTHHSVSKDGKTLTVTENGIDAEGKPVHATRVYDKE